MYCTNCGAALEKTDKFCFHCGIAQRERVIADRQHLPEPEYTQQDQIVSDEELELFIGKNAASYLNKWRQASHWNWPAFIFGQNWLLYRGMYLYFFLYLLLAPTIIGIAAVIVSPGYSFSIGACITMLLIGLSLQAAFACIANRLYLYHAKHKIIAIKQRYPDHREQQEEAIISAGETSLYIPIALALLPLLLAIVVSMFSYVNIYKRIQQDLQLNSMEIPSNRSVELLPKIIL
ncbi:DUF2628 domain-containing protein [Paenibacillus motobuensis]|uniref:DUF2628 domain-containing protein n=1 Tax=Paenibacillus TaxID=44249 RepID=UPI002041220A|nr:MULTISPECIES: DUF2628 domain-containing protein [Paenibacillus]MCM3042766.1 DUF2628 domain-containing protein [Paenibacillus lutimineralis]MCM3649870.1 DUF2628 domain-containing protein [Paenibacillus motobuensis]